MDDTYQVYVNRVARMTLPEAYQSQVQHIQPSPKFRRHQDGTVQATSFPGYSVITPPWVDDPQNATFYQSLQTYQQQVVEALEPGLLIPVPPDSFHVTLADLIWESAYLHAIADPAFDQKLQDCLTQSFSKYRFSVEEEKPIYWQVIGLFLRTRAVGVCLAPREEQSYERVMELRRTIYQNPDLIALGIEQQYNFTAHVTFGYFGEATLEADRDQIGDRLNDLSHEWLDSGLSPEVWIHRAELRKFDDMTRYYRQSDWPLLEF